MLLRQESESILGKCLNNKAQITDAQVWFAMFLSYYSRKNPLIQAGNSVKMYPFFVVDKLTAIIKPPNFWFCCTCHSHNLNSKYSFMIC